MIIKPRQNRSWSFLLLGMSLFIIPFSSCQKDAEIIDDLREVCFESEILPLIQNRCATTDCHDKASAAGYRFDSYNEIIRGLSAGDPANSALYRSIISTGENRMPPDGPLSISSRMLIRVWIEQGAVRTVCEDSTGNPVDTTGGENPWSNPYACFERDILPVMISSCGVSGCHDPVSMVEEYNFTTYNGILEGLNAGNPESSKIYKSISEDEASDIMPPPPYDPLSQAQIDTIYNWILRGAADEACGEACDTVDINYTSHLAAVIEASCTGCHSGSNPQGGISIGSYNDLLPLASNGNLVSVLRGNNGSPLMPPFNPLSECNIRKFEIWIDNGTPE